MNVYYELISNALAEQYGTGKVLAMAGLFGGYQNYIVKARTTEGSYTVKLLKHDTNLHELQNRISIQMALQDQSVRVPRVVPTSSGERWLELQDPLYGYMIVFEYIDGLPIFRHEVGKKQLGMVGKLISDLQVQMLPLQEEGDALPKAFEDIMEDTYMRAMTYSVDELQAQLYYEFGTTGPKWLKDVHAQLEESWEESATFMEEVVTLDLSGDSLIHNDLQRGNILFIDQQVVGLLDFDRMMKASLLYDLVHAITLWSIDLHAFVPFRTVKNTILRSFESTHLSEVEQEIVDDQNKMDQLLVYFIWLKTCFFLHIATDVYQKKDALEIVAMYKQLLVQAQQG